MHALELDAYGYVRIKEKLLHFGSVKFYCDHTSTCCNGAYVKHFAAGSG